MTTLVRLPSVRSATDAELDAACEHFNRLRAETHPDDPPGPLAEMRAGLRNIPDWVDVWPWWLCHASDGEVVGECHLFAGLGADAHVLTVELGVQREYRRRGIGASILREVADVAQTGLRTLLRAKTTERIPSGAAFCERLGATPISTSHTNRLTLSEVDRSQLATWSSAATDYQLTTVDGPCPDDRIEELAALLRMVNDDESFTAERIREGERMDQAGNATRWLLLARDGDGAPAGFTEIMWYPNNPRVVQQRWTYVHPDHRRHGLGSRLKADMLRRLLESAAEAEYVDTGNDDTNDAMLAINRALGFRPYIAETTWELGLDRLRAHLG